MKKFYIILLFTTALFAFSAPSFSQTGIGTTTPSDNAILDLTSTNKGLLIPRMTTAERTVMTPNASTDRGLQVYDTDTQSFWYWDGTVWINTALPDGLDATDDAWTNNNANSSIEIASKSDGVTARDAGTEVVVLDNGNVGIGTTAPATSFEVRNDGTPGVEGSEQLRIGDNGAGNALLSLNTSGQKAGFIGVDRATESMYFTNANLFSQNTLGDAHMVISTNGNVGIGSTDPDYKLVVGNDDGSLRIDGTGTGIGLVLTDENGISTIQSYGLNQHLALNPLGNNVVIGNNISSSNNAAILELSATDKGFLMTRMTSAQRTAIVPAPNTLAGLQVYDTDTQSFWFWNGTVWVNNTSSTATIGDVKTGLQTADHNGWILLDGRTIGSLTSSQQLNAVALGFGGGLPNASNAFLTQNGNTLGSVSGSNSKIIARNQLPNVNMGDIRTIASVSGGPSPIGAVAANGADTINLNGGVAQQSFDVTPRSLSINYFVYLGD